MGKERVLLNLSLDDYAEFEAKRNRTGMSKQTFVKIILSGRQPVYKIEEEVRKVLSALNHVNFASQTMTWWTPGNNLPTYDKHKENMKWLGSLISAIVARNVKWKFNNETINEKAGFVKDPALNIAKKKIKE